MVEQAGTNLLTFVTNLFLDPCELFLVPLRQAFGLWLGHEESVAGAFSGRWFGGWDGTFDGIVTCVRRRLVLRSFSSIEIPGLGDVVDMVYPLHADG